MEIINQLMQTLNPYCGYILPLGIIVILALGYLGAPLILWVLALGLMLLTLGCSAIWFLVFCGISLLFLIRPLRRVLFSGPIMKVMKSILPKISDTERTALEAGVVWVESELFSGRPNFHKILKESYPKLNAEEQAFIDGPVEEVCSMIDDWSIWQNRKIPDNVWNKLKEYKFFGMIIPKNYGGLGFSALAHSAVIQKLSSKSIPASVTVMVPNSLGPAELLLHYGTQEQKDRLLPKLASGEEIPCFGLTEPTAGSDAGSILSYGDIYKSESGEVSIRLNWNKRWITLASISTTLGLAFNLRDPDNILGRGKDLGITCALIPTKSPGVVVGQRHDPLGVPFYNCPTQGVNVEIPLEKCVVGGMDGIGKGWHMLMDCLGAGRGISLPSQSAGGTKSIYRYAGAHAVIRKQFGLSIGKFEGVGEPLARIGAYNYMLEACRTFTCGAIDAGVKPPVVTAIAKYHCTEAFRTVINDAMDIVGGAAISRGPKNFLAHPYIATPISITVEGANILTRTLMIFGQGALRAHPFAYKEVKAAENNDVKAFDLAFWGHIGHITQNKFRAFLLSVTRGRLALSVPGGPLKRCYQKLSWASACFAILADVAMGSLGGTLKFREKITGRFADILSWLYLGTATLRRFEADGRLKEDLPYVRFIMEMAFSEMQKAFLGILKNLKVPGFTWFFKYVLGSWTRFNSFGEGPSDAVGGAIVKSMLQPGALRDRHTDGIWQTEDMDETFGRLDVTFRKCFEAAEVEKKVKKAMKKKLIPKSRISVALDAAVEKSVITEAEKNLLAEVEQLRWEAIQVDDFSEEEYQGYSTNHQVSGLDMNLSGK